MTDWIEIDGSMGEGGGQVLRSSLALSMVTGRAIRVTRIRAGRPKPGLMRQHMTAVLAAAQVSRGQTGGVAPNSQEIWFEPGEPRAGEYRLDIGTAGSTTLILQTILPALAAADGPSRVELIGGTHNPLAPPYEFLAASYLPLVGRMGPVVDCGLHEYGFAPAGQGRLIATIQPGKWRPLQLVRRGAIVRRRATAIVSNLPRHIAEREMKVVAGQLGWSSNECSVQEVNARGPGNIVLLELGCDQLAEVFSACGRKGLPAERVAKAAASAAAEYLDAGVPVGEHLADQLLLPLSLAGGGKLLTMPLSRHTLTQMELIPRFLDVQISTSVVTEGQWLLEVFRNPRVS